MIFGLKRMTPCFIYPLQIFLYFYIDNSLLHTVVKNVCNYLLFYQRLFINTFLSCVMFM